METVSNSIEDALISGSSYKLDATASYITERKSCTYYAMGGNAYAPNSGTKVIKISNKRRFVVRSKYGQDTI